MNTRIALHQGQVQYNLDIPLSFLFLFSPGSQQKSATWIQADPTTIVLRDDNNILDILNHVQSHFHGTNGMIGAGHGQSTNAVVTIAQQLDAMAVVLLQRNAILPTTGQDTINQAPIMHQSLEMRPVHANHDDNRAPVCPTNQHCARHAISISSVETTSRRLFCLQPN